MDRVAALLLAGGRGVDFGPLSASRTKAAFPVAGHYRIVDFALSNLSETGVRQVGVIIQYMPAPLIEHIGSGRPWDFDMADRSIRLMTPHVGVEETRWFRGTADAIAKNLNLLDLRNVTEVLVLSAEHIYRMDYRPMIYEHRRLRADVTMAYVDIPTEDQHPRFGTLRLDDNGRVLAFVDKPPRPISPHVSMGVFCFRLDCLLDLLTIAKPDNDNGEFMLPGGVLEPHVSGVKSYGWKFDKPWHYLPDLQGYFDFHMALARGEVDPPIEDWGIMTNFGDRRLGWRPPAYLSPDSEVEDAVLSPGVHVEGEVRSAVLSPGVRIAPGARVDRAIILHDSQIDENAEILNAIVDKDTHVAAGCRIGSPSADRVTVLPKGFRVRPGQHIGPDTHLESPIVQ